MVFRLEDGRTRFYQWDTGIRVIVSDSSITEVHFCNTTEDCSLVVDAYTENGFRYADVPNVLLQKAYPIRVYGFDETYTKHYTVFNIVARTKPADYVYTETEIKSWDAIQERMDKIEATVTTEGVQKAVEEYLQENPVDVDMSEYYTKKEVDDAIETIELTPGPQGKPGKDGEDGYTPRKGVDYFDGEDGEDGKDYVLTEEDKAEIAAMVEVSGGDFSNYYTKKEVDNAINGNILRIETNAANISALSSAINANSKQIQNHDMDIETNAGNIRVNSTDITKLQEDVKSINQTLNALGIAEEGAY